jgi:hypothetical protein
MCGGPDFTGNAPTGTGNNPVKLQYPPLWKPGGGGGPICGAPIGLTTVGPPGGSLASDEASTQTGGAW